MSEEIIRLHYDINDEDFSAAGEASSGVKKTLSALGVSPETVKRVAIAMYEAEINAVIHADGGVADIEITPEQIKVVISDRGPGIPNMEAAMQPGFSTASETVRELGFGAGMGLPNMKKHTDDMKIDTVIGEGTTITMRVNT